MTKIERVTVTSVWLFSKFYPRISVVTHKAWRENEISLRDGYPAIVEHENHVLFFIFVFLGGISKANSGIYNRSTIGKKKKKDRYCIDKGFCMTWLILSTPYDNLGSRSVFLILLDVLVKPSGAVGAAQCLNSHILGAIVTQLLGGICDLGGALESSGSCGMNGKSG